MVRSERKDFENPYLLKQSKASHANDVKNNREPLGYQPKKRETQHPKSKAFEARWG